MKWFQSLQFYYFAVFHFLSVYLEADQGALLLPALLTRCSGVDVEKFELAVIDDLKDMRVTVNHQFDLIFLEQILHSRRPFAGVATDMSEQYFDIFAIEDKYFRAFTLHKSVVDISAHSSHNRCYLLQPLYDSVISDVSGMPDLIATFKIFCIAVIPITMRVTQDSYLLHDSEISPIAFSNAAAIDAAARRPSPMARITVAGPRTMSPPA